jgi:hypothetical protein
MGHTHMPSRTIVNDGASTYVNVGSWAEEEANADVLAGERHHAACTHLVIRPGDPHPTAELLAWGPSGLRLW